MSNETDEQPERGAQYRALKAATDTLTRLRAELSMLAAAWETRAKAPGSQALLPAEYAAMKIRVLLEEFGK